MWCTAGKLLWPDSLADLHNYLPELMAQEMRETLREEEPMLANYSDETLEQPMTSENLSRSDEERTVRLARMKTARLKMMSTMTRNWSLGGIKRRVMNLPTRGTLQLSSSLLTMFNAA